MTEATETVLANALRLGLSERAELATELLASLEGPADAGAAAWEADIMRRVRALEAGTLEIEPWDEVRRRTETELLDK